MRTLLKDENEFGKFISILPEIKDDELFFISLSARNKYLKQEEREKLDLGKTEMFGRTTARDKEGLRYALKKLESVLSYRRTRNGSIIPEECLVVYININPSSTIRAFQNFKKEMENAFTEAFFAEKQEKKPNYTHFQNIEKNLLNNIQKSRSRKEFIDIDFDVENLRLVSSFENFLNKNRFPTEHWFIIQTQGGYHVLLRKDYLEKLNIWNKVQELDKEAKKTNGEVIINKNEMVPLPGTHQAGKLVKVL